MFFAPHLAQQAEEDAAEEAARRDPPAPPVDPTVGDGVSRVVGTVERIQVELASSSVPGSEETVSLPDGRVVKFTVPSNFKAGDVIEVEVSRQAFSRNAKKTTMTREEIAKFFSLGIEAMEKAREQLKSGDRPGDQLVEMQQVAFDDMGVDRTTGCRLAGRVATDYPADQELAGLQTKFMYTAQTTFLRALDDRKPKKLETKRMMTKAEVLEFFNACNTKVALDDTRQMLASVAKRTKKLPNEAMIALQRAMLETLGYEADHGCACLNKIQVDYPNDPELQQGMRVWAMTAANACKLALQDADPALQPDSDDMKSMTQLQAKALSHLETMTADDQNALLNRMRKKVEVFAKLAATDRLRYVNKLPEQEKIDFVVAQNLLMRQMNQQMANMNFKA